MRILIENGADIDTVNRYNETALISALDRGILFENFKIVQCVTVEL